MYAHHTRLLGGLFVAGILMLVPLQSAVAISSLSVDIYMAQNTSTIATISVEDGQGESLTGIINSDENVDIIEG